MSDEWKNARAEQEMKESGKEIMKKAQEKSNQNKVKELPDDYDITVDNMIGMSAEHVTDDFKIHHGIFYSMNDGKDKSMNVLKHESPEGVIKQIFQMNDGKFILEVEEFGEVTYFYSDKLSDLV